MFFAVVADVVTAVVAALAGVVDIDATYCLLT